MHKTLIALEPHLHFEAHRCYHPKSPSVPIEMRGKDGNYYSFEAGKWYSPEGEQGESQKGWK